MIFLSTATTVNAKCIAVVIRYIITNALGQVTYFSLDIALANFPQNPPKGKIKIQWVKNWVLPTVFLGACLSLGYTSTHTQSLAELLKRMFMIGMLERKIYATGIEGRSTKQAEKVCFSREGTGVYLSNKEAMYVKEEAK